MSSPGEGGGDGCTKTRVSLPVADLRWLSHEGNLDALRITTRSGRAGSSVSKATVARLGPRGGEEDGVSAARGF